MDKTDNTQTQRKKVDTLANKIKNWFSESLDHGVLSMPRKSINHCIEEYFNLAYLYTSYLQHVFVNFSFSAHQWSVRNGLMPSTQLLEACSILESPVVWLLNSPVKYFLLATTLMRVIFYYFDQDNETNNQDQQRKQLYSIKVVTNDRVSAVHQYIIQPMSMVLKTLQQLLMPKMQLVKGACLSIGTSAIATRLLFTSASRIGGQLVKGLSSLQINSVDKVVDLLRYYLLRLGQLMHIVHKTDGEQSPQDIFKINLTIQYSIFAKITAISHLKFSPSRENMSDQPKICRRMVSFSRQLSTLPEQNRLSVLGSSPCSTKNKNHHSEPQMHKKSM